MTSQADAAAATPATTGAPPRKRGNRGISALLAIPATLIFLGILIAIQYVISGGDLGFLREPSFYFAALFLFVGLVLIGLVLNRSGWWSHVFGSVVSEQLFGSVLHHSR